MSYGQGGHPRPPRVPAIGEMWDRFPGPIAIPVLPIGDSSRHLSYSAINSEPWSIDIVFTSAASHLLTVRTVRSRVGLDPYGLPVEDLPNVIVDAANAHASRPGGPGVSVPDPEAWVREHIGGTRVTRQEVAGTPTVTTSVMVDGVLISAIRVDVGGWAAVRLTWGEQLVFCAGRPEILNGLALRTATSDDLAHT